MVVPLYNERESLPELECQLSAVLQEIGQPYEILFVDDGSRDGSFQVLVQLHDQDPRIRVVQLRRNYGKSAALAVGFQESRGAIVFTLDADLQDDPSEIPQFLAALEKGYDLVSGWKYKRQDPWTKTVPSRLFNWTTALLTGIKLHDFNCGFKVYRRIVIEDLRIYGELHRYIPVLAHLNGFRIGEIKVHHQPRKYGQTKFGVARFIHGFLDLLTVLFHLKYTRQPLKLFGLIGFLLFGIGMGINLYLTIIWFGGAAIGSRPLLLLGVLMTLVGIQFVSIGLLGEMLARSSQTTADYSVREKL